MGKVRQGREPSIPNPVTATRRPQTLPNTKSARSGSEKKALPSGSAGSRIVGIRPSTRCVVSNEPVESRRIATHARGTYRPGAFPGSRVAKSKIIGGRKSANPTCTSTSDVDVNVNETEEKELYEMEKRRNMLNEINNDFTVKIASLLREVGKDETVKSNTPMNTDSSNRTPLSILSQYSDRLDSVSRKLRVAHTELDEIQRQIVDNINLADGKTVKHEDASNIGKAHTDTRPSAALPHSAIHSGEPNGRKKQLRMAGHTETGRSESLAAHTNAEPNLTEHFQILGERVVEAVHAAVAKTTKSNIPPSMDRQQTLTESLKSEALKNVFTLHPIKDEHMLPSDGDRSRDRLTRERRNRQSWKSRDVAPLRRTKSGIVAEKENHKKHPLNARGNKARLSGDSVPFAGVIAEHVRAVEGDCGKCKKR